MKTTQVGQKLFPNINLMISFLNDRLKFHIEKILQKHVFNKHLVKTIFLDLTFT